MSLMPVVEHIADVRFHAAFALQDLFKRGAWVCSQDVIAHLTAAYCIQGCGFRSLFYMYFETEKDTDRVIEIAYLMGYEPALLGDLLCLEPHVCVPDSVIALGVSVNAHEKKCAVAAREGRRIELSDFVRVWPCHSRFLVVE